MAKRVLTKDRRFKDQMWQKVATEMGIPWRSAESMHWQLGEQEMSARANAPVFQLHPSATGLSSPPSVPAVPAPAPHGFTPTNAPQLVPHPPPPPPALPQQHQPGPPPPPGPIHSYHQRSESATSQGRRRNSSFSRRRIASSRSSVPPQLGPTLPQIQPQSEADLISGARTAPAPETHSGVKRLGEGDAGGLGEPFMKRRREEEGGGALRPGVETRSEGGRSPDRASQRSGTGSVKSAKRGDPDEPEQPANEPPPSAT